MLQGHVDILGTYQDLMNKGFEFESVVQKNVNATSQQGDKSLKITTNAVQENMKSEKCFFDSVLHVGICEQMCVRVFLIVWKRVHLLFQNYSKVYVYMCI